MKGYIRPDNIILIENSYCAYAAHLLVYELCFLRCMKKEEELREEREKGEYWSKVENTHTQRIYSYNLVEKMGIDCFNGRVCIYAKYSYVKQNNDGFNLIETTKLRWNSPIKYDRWGWWWWERNVRKYTTYLQHKRPEFYVPIVFRNR